MTKICIYCNTSFETNNPNKRLCSKECQGHYTTLLLKGRPQKLQCKQCGKTFYRSEHMKFCSPECRNIYIENGKNKKSFNGIKKPTSLDETLAYCRKVGLDYAEYQKLNTIAEIRKEEQNEY